ncbi:methyl-accepting chemotaxis protein, partial [Aquabacterium sp. UBA2148]|uniref:methyl-accepting chemotaxis protein n=1 Tax=Aquabacterium sp. UBA2148 TaxID=1946042 RepID=UPI00257E386B
MRSSASIAHRLGAVLGGLLLLIVAMVALAWSQMGAMRGSEKEIIDNWLPSVELVNQLNTNISDQRILEFRHVLNTDESAMRGIEAELTKVKAEFNSLHDAYKALLSSDQERTQHAAFERSWGEYLRLHEQVMNFSRQNQNDQARALLEGDAQKSFDQATADLVALIKLNSDGAKAAGHGAEGTYVFARNALLVSALLGLLVGTVAAVWLTRSITRPIESALAVAEGVAEGNLAQHIEVNSSDELGRLLGSLRTMQGRLSDVVSGVRGSAEGVATASAQIAQGNLDLSQRTEEQASAVQQTAATMEEVGSTVRNNADAASQANQMAQGASEVAMRGGDVVGQVVQTMQGINDSSRKINDIIGTIDGIAFQTNILAL